MPEHAPSDGAGPTLAWIDAGGGISGDMLLGACLDAGAPLTVIQGAIDALGLAPRISVTSREVRRAGLRATQAIVTHEPDASARHLREIVALLEAAELPAGVAERAVAVFSRLARAEARVHGVPVAEVHFHEVGALDSIADVVGTLAGFAALGITEVVCGPITLGGGTAQASHGTLPVPVPAVLELLRESGAVAAGGPSTREQATPTGVALALGLAQAFGPLPPMSVTSIGLGAGSADLPDRANVCRLVLGVRHAAADDGPVRDQMTLIETNVDDLDPRLWPPALAALLAGGAADAWLTPILMKKGRPAHTLHVLAAEQHVSALVDLIFAHTSSIGLRLQRVGRLALRRDVVTVEVDGTEVAVKRAWLGGRLTNAEPEFADVLASAARLGLPPRVVLRRAQLLASVGPEAGEHGDSQDGDDHEHGSHRGDLRYAGPLQVSPVEGELDADETENRG
jgi:uncharacterized protein (TIGR00299 family) protein